MITKIRWTIAEGNVFSDDLGELDRERSLGQLQERILQALAEAYPGAEIEVGRANVEGAAEELEAQSDEPDGYVHEDELEVIRAIADEVWAGDWEVPR